MNEIKHISELTPDSRNVNRGTLRGAGFLKDSLRKFGAGRSILVDKNGVIIAGNKTAEQAGAIGIEDVILVQSDGTKLVAVQRTDLDIEDPRTRELAIADNRISEVNLEWDTDVLKELQEGGVDLGSMWNQNEFDHLVGEIPTPDDVDEHWTGMPQLLGEPRACRALMVYFETPANVNAFISLLGVAIMDKTKSIWYPKAPY